jgi:hypothetical protein
MIEFLHSISRQKPYEQEDKEKDTRTETGACVDEKGRRANTSAVFFRSFQIACLCQPLFLFVYQLERIGAARL